jgi:arylsulfatase A-like enzyme
MTRIRTVLIGVTCIFVLILSSGCDLQSSKSPLTLSLAELYTPESVVGGGAAITRPERTEWGFEPSPEAGTGPTLEWKPGHQVSSLRVQNGRLTGRTSGDFPIIHVHRTEGPQDDDLLHSIEIKLTVTGGADLRLSTSGSEEELDIQQVVRSAGDFPWSMGTPLIAGETIRAYIIRPPRPIKASSIKHLLISPTDSAGASFEIESVRLIFRKEHLAGIPTGFSWQGLSEIYQDALVSRSPERVELDVTLPPRAWLDLSVGSIEEEPITFRIGVRRDGDSREEILASKTITRPHSWQHAPVELSAYGGERVTLVLAADSEDAGKLAFWGSPVIRRHGALPVSSKTAAAKKRPAGSPPQGVIIVWADTLRQDHLGAYGYERNTSPVIDQLAAEGARFDRSAHQATWTKVSTPSLMTGLHPTSHTVKEFSDRLPSTAETLAEIMAEAGYATLSMSSFAFTGQFTNLHQGFQEMHEGTSITQNPNKTAREYVDRLLPWLDQHKSVPFFVFLHLTDPHDPYKPYPPYDRMWADPDHAEAHEADLDKAREVMTQPLMRAFGMPTREEMLEAGLDPEEFINYDTDWYDGSIRAMDAEMGRMVEHLKSIGLGEKTLIVFTSDHGEEFLEHGRMFHGQTTYGELANAPLIMWKPGTIPASGEIGANVAIIDVMPTILEMAGLYPPDAVQGRSLLPLLLGSETDTEGTGAGSPQFDIQGRPFGDRAVITERLQTNPDEPSPPPHDEGSIAVTFGRWKLVHNYASPANKPEYELYDIEADPLNLTDIAFERPGIVEGMKMKLDEWRVIAENGILKSDAAASSEMSAEELDRLRSLGYIQ